MGFIENFTFGALEGVAALIVVIAVALAAVAILVVVILNGIKSLKEHKDDLEDRQEDEFFAEYGITGEEMRLNQQIADMKDRLRSKRRLKGELDSEKQVVIVRESAPEQAPAPVPEPVVVPVQETAPEPVREEPPVQETVSEPVLESVKEEPISEPAPEPVPEPIIEPVSEPVVESEPVKELDPAPVVEPVAVEEKKPEPVEVAEEPAKPKKAAKKVTPKKKPDDWSRYDGDYEGVYYDPEDACYYEGEPSPEVAAKLAAKRAELDAAAKKNKKEVIVKKVSAPFLSLKTPKHERKTPEKVKGFDEAIIYGKYVIEHDKDAEGNEEYYYTLYDPSGNTLYESSNYRSLEYCKRAIARFKTHVMVGEYSIDAENGKFFFVITRKTYVHAGAPQKNYDEAFKLVGQVKNYGMTDIIREQ